MRNAFVTVNDQQHDNMNYAPSAATSHIE